MEDMIILTINRPLHSLILPCKVGLTTWTPLTATMETVKMVEIVRCSWANTSQIKIAEKRFPGNQATCMASEEGGYGKDP